MGRSRNNRVRNGGLARAPLEVRRTGERHAGLWRRFRLAFTGGSRGLPFAIQSPTSFSFPERQKSISGNNSSGDRAARETVDDLDAEFLRGAGGVGDFLSSATAHAFGIAIAPQTRRQNTLVALINHCIGDALTDEVMLEQIRPRPAVLRLRGQRFEIPF